MYTTTLAEACSHGDLDVLKRLKPDPLRDDLGGFLRHAAFSPHTENLSFLLGLKADPNDREDAGSSALDRCLCGDN